MSYKIVVSSGDRGQRFKSSHPDQFQERQVWPFHLAKLNVRFQQLSRRRFRTLNLCILNVRLRPRLCEKRPVIVRNGDYSAVRSVFCVAAGDHRYRTEILAPLPIKYFIAAA